MNSGGTFISYSLEKEAIDEIKKELYKYGFTNLFVGFSPHITIISDDKDVQDLKYIPFNGSLKPISFSVFKGRLQHCLVLVVESPELEKIYKEYIEKYGFKEKYDKYIPHISFSYSLERSIGMKIYDDEVITNLIKNLNIPLPNEIKINKLFIG
jgi:2'-5' RNA ligase